MTDFTFTFDGSLCVLCPNTDAAQEWVDANLPEDAQNWGGGVVIEPRYAGAILEGLVADGLTVERGGLIQRRT